MRVCNFFQVLSAALVLSSCNDAKEKVKPIPTSEDAVTLNLSGANEFSGTTQAVQGEQIEGKGFALVKIFKFAVTQKMKLTLVGKSAGATTPNCDGLSGPMLSISSANSEEAISLEANESVTFDSGAYELMALVATGGSCNVKAQFTLKSEAATGREGDSSATQTSTATDVGTSTTTDVSTDTGTTSETASSTDTNTNTDTDPTPTPAPTAQPTATPVVTRPVLNGKYDVLLRGIWEMTNQSGPSKVQLYVEEQSKVEQRVIVDSKVVARIKYNLDMDSAKAQLVLAVSSIEGTLSGIKVGDFQACLYSVTSTSLKLACLNTGFPQEMSNARELKKVNDPYSYLGYLIQVPYYRYYMSTHSCGMKVSVSGNTVTTTVIPESGVSSSQCSGEVSTYTCKPFENECVSSGRVMQICANGDFHLMRSGDGLRMSNRMYFGKDGPTAQGNDNHRYQGCEIEVPLEKQARKEIDAALIPNRSYGHWSYSNYGPNGLDFATDLKITTSMTGSEKSSKVDRDRRYTVVEDFDFTIVSDRVNKAFVRTITAVRTGNIKVGDVHKCTYRAWYYSVDRIQFYCTGGALSSGREFIDSY